jgi:hypothetical protein
LNPDVAQAVSDLVSSGILSREKAAPLRRTARRELVSVYTELRLLLYTGVLLIAAGAGVLIERNFRSIGPVTVTLAVAVAAVAALSWVVRSSPPFSWTEVAQTSPAFEYILLLGVLLASADLAFIEYQFTPLGANWPWHLAVVAIFMGVLSVRFDSRTVFSLALSTFAAWRGVSTSFLEHAVWRSPEDLVRWNAVACGVLFVLLGRYLSSTNRKAHFEPVAVHMGWLLILAALVSAAPLRGAEGILCTILLFTTGLALAWRALYRRRFVLFAFGLLGSYIAASIVAVEFIDTPLWLITSAAVLIAWLWRVQRRKKEST